MFTYTSDIVGATWQVAPTDQTAIEKDFIASWDSMEKFFANYPTHLGWEWLKPLPGLIASSVPDNHYIYSSCHDLEDTGYEQNNPSWHLNYFMKAA